MTISKQSLASTLRQVLAVVVSLIGVLTQTDAGLKLPVALSAILVAFAPVLLVVEHWLSDPSTGTPAGSSTAGAGTGDDHMGGTPVSVAPQGGGGGGAASLAVVPPPPVKA